VRGTNEKLMKKSNAHFEKLITYLWALIFTLSNYSSLLGAIVHLWVLSMLQVSFWGIYYWGLEETYWKYHVKY
jgi:hypothetical protein